MPCMNCHAGDDRQTCLSLNCNRQLSKEIMVLAQLLQVSFWNNIQALQNVQRY